MTRGTPRGQKAAQPRPAASESTPEPVPDPLADLREPDGLDPVILTETPGDATYPEPEWEPVALVTQEAWDESRTRAVVAMHADTVTLGFLHKGGACGCRYIAGVILQAVMPVAPEPGPEPEVITIPVTVAPDGTEV